MKKKILAAVMAATMVFSLVACGSSDAGSNAATGSANAATGSANAATESASAGTTSSSSSGDMIKVASFFIKRFSRGCGAARNSLIR